MIATPHADHAEADPPVARGRQARPLREAPDHPGRRGAGPGDPGRRVAAEARHRPEPPVLSARPRRPGPGRLVGDRPGRERPGRDRPPGHARVPQVVAHRGRAIRRRDPDGQRPARLRPDPPVPRRGRAGQGVRPPGRPPPRRLRDRGPRPVPQPRQRRGRAPCELGLAVGLPDRRGPRERGLPPDRDRPLAAHRQPRRRPAARPPLPGRSRARAGPPAPIRLRAVDRPRAGGLRLARRRPASPRRDRLGRLPGRPR